MAGRSSFTWARRGMAVGYTAQNACPGTGCSVILSLAGAALTADRAGGTLPLVDKSSPIGRNSGGRANLGNDEIWLKKCRFKQMLFVVIVEGWNCTPFKNSVNKKEERQWQILYYSTAVAVWARTKPNRHKSCKRGEPGSVNLGPTW